MTTPDEKAAAFDPDAPALAPVKRVADLTAAHFGAIIETCGITGELISCFANQNIAGGYDLKVQEEGRPFPTVFGTNGTTSCEILDTSQVRLSDVVTMDGFYELARELDRVSEEIRKNTESNKTLTERKRQLSEQLLGTFAQVGEQTLAFSNGSKSRRAYIHHEIVPEFEEKDDGTPYTYRDLVPILREIGREEQITPETVNYRTMQGFLREVRDGVIPMPPEMAKMVKIGEKAEVRTGVGRRPSR